MASGRYSLGKRQASVERTQTRIVQAARELVAAGSGPSVGEVAARAGVSRITIYNRFGSKAGLLSSLRPRDESSTLPDAAPAREQLHQYVLQMCSNWARDPALYRNLAPGSSDTSDETSRLLAERLAAVDELRPGCSLKEAEDVIVALTSFATFDRLHHGGRRSVSAVAEILIRMASGILGYHP